MNEADEPTPLVRRLWVDEADQARALRLSALAGAPRAFVEDYATAVRRPSSFWEEQTRRGAVSDEVATFVAVGDQRHVGTATGLCVDPQAPAELVAMWVEPDVRRRGIGKALVDRVCRWAAERGARSITLDLHEGNDAALRLYESTGFVVVRGPAPTPYDPSMLEVQMARSL